jgi:orotidine-5'-phosphate decarboxylase
VRELEGSFPSTRSATGWPYAGGLELARDLAAQGTDIFLDLKLLDIDNTVAEGVESVVKLGATMLTVHAYPKAMRAAAKAAQARTSASGRHRADLDGRPGPCRCRLCRDRSRISWWQDAPAGARGRHWRHRLRSQRGGSAVRGIVGPDGGGDARHSARGCRPWRPEARDDAGRRDPRRASHLVVARPVVGAPDRRAAAQAIIAEMQSAI